MAGRDVTIDALRGIAVTLMVASHTVWFLSNGDSSFWNFMRSLGDAVCFITFLFVFGITLYLSVLSKDFNLPENRAKSRKRILELVTVYFLIAASGLLVYLGTHEFDNRLVQTLLLQYPPGFTEFMLVFILFSIVAYVYKELARKTGMQISRLRLDTVVVVSFIVYAVAQVWYSYTRNAQFPETVEAYLALLLGFDGYLRFDLLHYLPVLLLGVYAGFLMKDGEGEKRNLQKFLQQIFIFFGLLSLGLWASELQLENSAINMFVRWPASLLFLTCGLTFALGSLLVLRRFPAHSVTHFFSKIGTEALGILAFHIVVLWTATYFGVQKTGNFIYLSGYFIILLFGFILCKRALYPLRHKTVKAKNAI